MKDLTGQTFERLTVLKLSSTPTKSGKIAWTCLCSCGKEVSVGTSDLTTGNTRSCGCYKRDNHSQYMHGASHTKEHNTWCLMQRRCYKTYDPAFFNYGGRGIQVCDRWRESFTNFLEDMGYALTPSHSIDRIDNDGNYEPGNCKWATPKEQSNNRRNVIQWEYQGYHTTQESWSVILGVPQASLSRNLRAGWTIEKVIQRRNIHVILPTI